MVFVYNPNGKAEAMPGRHDDRIIDHAIGVYVCTLGANAWGGTGVLQGVDGAGLPVGTATVVTTPVAPVAVPDAPASPVWGTQLTMAFPSSATPVAPVA
jgi:hypothetical protein